MAREEARARVIEDANTGYNATVSADGRLAVSAQIGGVPEIPDGATAVSQVAFGSVATTSGDDTAYTITNGNTLTIQRFSAACEDETGGTVVELFEDPNGDLSVLNRIETIILSGNTYQVGLGVEYSGDGTRRIIMRRRGYTSSGREVFGRWEGYEE